MKKLLKNYFTKKVERYLWIENLVSAFNFFIYFEFIILLVTIATHNEIYELLKGVLK